MKELNIEMNNPLEELKVKAALNSENRKFEYRTMCKPEDINILDYVIIAALEKQIGIKPIEIFLSEITRSWQCTCGNLFKGQLGDRPEYCSRCGQKVNWRLIFE